MEKTDCFAYRKRRGDGASLCVALTRCYCVEEDCPFYMTKCERGKKAAKAMARNAEVGIDTEKYKNQRKVPNYCANCGAKMELGGKKDES